MINKQQFIKSALTTTFLFLLIFSGANAQVSDTRQTDSVRTAKIKIVEKEGDHYLMLDTTLSLAPGITIREAVKNLKDGGVSLKSLGAKVIQPTSVSGSLIFRTGPGQGLDSSRNEMFIRGKVRTIVTENINITFADSAFKSLRSGRVLFRSNPNMEDSALDKAQSITYIRSRPIIARSLSLDSTFRGRVIYVRDSSFHNLPEIKTIEKIRVLKGDQGDELKIISLKDGGSESILELGDYTVSKITSGQNRHILILRSSKEKLSKVKKPVDPSKIDVQVYPNPTSGIITLAFTVMTRADTKVRIVDSQGKAVFEDTKSHFQGAYSKEINLGKFGTGTYVIQLLSGKIIQSEKVLVL